MKLISDMPSYLTTENLKIFNGDISAFSEYMHKNMAPTTLPNNGDETLKR
jgi:hypothetical protein